MRSPSKVNTLPTVISYMISPLATSRLEKRSDATHRSSGCCSASISSTLGLRPSDSACLAAKALAPASPAGRSRSPGSLNVASSVTSGAPRSPSALDIASTKSRIVLGISIVCDPNQCQAVPLAQLDDLRQRGKRAEPQPRYRIEAMGAVTYSCG